MLICFPKVFVVLLLLGDIASQFLYQVANSFNTSPWKATVIPLMVSSAVVKTTTNSVSYTFVTADDLSNVMLRTVTVTSGTTWTSSTPLTQMYCSGSTCGNNVPPISSSVVIPNTNFIILGTALATINIAGKGKGAKAASTTYIGDLAKIDITGKNGSFFTEFQTEWQSGSYPGFMSMAYLAGNFFLSSDPLMVTDYTTMNPTTTSAYMKNIQFLVCLNGNSCAACNVESGVSKTIAYDITQANFLSGGADNANGAVVDNSNACIGVAGYSSASYYIICSTKTCYARKFDSGDFYSTNFPVPSSSNMQTILGMTEGSFDYLLFLDEKKLSFGYVNATASALTYTDVIDWSVKVSYYTSIWPLNNMETITYINDQSGKDPTVYIYKRTMCATGCAVCSGSVSTCTKCYTGYVLSGYSCIATLTCPANCSNCSSNTVCTACNANFYLLPNSSCSNCAMNGYFIAGSNCNQCDASCATCSGTSNHCLTCPSGKYLNATAFTCSPCTAPGTFIDGSSCSNCDSNCATCSGSAVHCLTCPSGNYLNPTAFTCSACTTAGTFINGSSCLNCDTNCATCSSTSAHCLTCPSGNYLNPTAYTCSVCTTPGTFISGSSCLNCDVNCATCSGTSTHCLTCSSGNYLNVTTYTCSGCTLPGTFTSGTSCNNCNANCATCSGTAVHCLTCPSGNYLNQSAFTCSPCTTPGTFFSGSNCLNCDSSCATCSGSATHCLTCPSGNYLNTTTFTCSACTAAGTFINGTSCSNCDSNCATCSGSAPHCLTCPSGNYLNPTAYTCSVCTTPGTFISGSSCLNCDVNCATCSGSATHCLTCPSGSSLLANSTCGGCPAGQYSNGASCQTCNANCANCSSSATNCTTCPSGQYLSTANRTCGPCNSGYFVSGSNCTACSSNCATCSGSSTSCTACPSGTNLLSDFTCGTCPSGQYSNGATCSQCSANCLTCNTTQTTCLTCGGSLYLYPNKTCGSCGDSGYFISASSCLKCDSSCQTCATSATKCITCPVSKYLYPNNTCGSCLDTAFFTNGSYCSQCDANCKSCSGTSKACTSCSSGLALNATNSCVSCTGAQFVNPTDLKCYPCSSNCATCSNSASNCDTCLASNYLLPNKTCVACTPASNPGFFVSGSQCLPCSLNCSTCSGSSTSCTSCPAGSGTYLFSNGNCAACSAQGLFISNNASCLPCSSNCTGCSTNSTHCTVCATGFFLDSNSVCSPCLKNCSSCANGTSCSACQTGMLLTGDNQCISSSDCTKNPGTFNLNNSNCGKCSSNCANCSLSAQNCTSCPSNQALYPNSTCGSCAEEGWFRSNLTCANCDSSCQTCNGSASSNCLTCTSPKQLTPNNTCEIPPVSPISLKGATWDQSLSQVTFAFSQEISSRTGQISEHSAIMLFACSSAELSKEILGLKASASFEGLACQKAPVGWKVGKMSIVENRLLVQLEVTDSLANLGFAMRFDQEAFLRSPTSSSVAYPPAFLLADGITVIKTAFDQAMTAAAAPAAASMTAIQLAVMGISLPQAFILLKIMQTLDYYIYINCDLPTNFQAFLQLITNNALQYIPNLFAFLAPDSEEQITYDRFAQFGQTARFFSNVGTQVTMISFIAAIRFVLWIFCRLLRKLKKLPKLQGIYDYASLELIYGLFESNHLDFLLAYLIFFGYYETMNLNISFNKLLSTVLIGAIMIGTVCLYFFMAKTVKRITIRYFRTSLIEVKDMKTESWRFWLSDKNIKGNLFQRHYNLLCLMKDIVFALFLYKLYYYPLPLILILSFIQAGFIFMIFRYPPYILSWMNMLLRTTNVLYLTLNVLFAVYIMFGNKMSITVAYYGIGFSMIGVVIFILCLNVGFSMYYSVKEMVEACKKKKESQIEAAESTQNNSSVMNISKNTELDVSSKVISSQLAVAKDKIRITSPKTKVNSGGKASNKVHMNHIEPLHPPLMGHHNRFRKKHIEHVIEPPVKTDAKEGGAKIINKKIKVVVDKEKDRKSIFEMNLTNMESLKPGTSESKKQDDSKNAPPTDRTMGVKIKGKSTHSSSSKGKKIKLVPNFGKDQ